VSLLINKLYAGCSTTGSNDSSKALFNDDNLCYIVIFNNGLDS